MSKPPFFKNLGFYLFGRSLDIGGQLYKPVGNGLVGALAAALGFLLWKLAISQGMGPITIIMVILCWLVGLGTIARLVIKPEETSTG